MPTTALMLYGAEIRGLLREKNLPNFLNGCIQFNKI